MAIFRNSQLFLHFNHFLEIDILQFLFIQLHEKKQAPNNPDPKETPRNSKSK